MVAPLFFLLLVALIVAAVLATALRRARRAEMIRSYAFPKGLLDKLHRRRPELAAKDLQLVSRALRQFFLAHLKSGGQFVSMPSQVVDDLWHEFILYTRHYELFCREAFGGFLHHTPAVVLGPQRRDNAGLRRTWWWCCREENIDPRKPSRLPLLFAIDAKLGIADGFRYVPDCGPLRRDGDGSSVTVHCGADFSSDAVDGSTDGFPDGDGGSDGGGDGGGCGGSSGD